MKRKLGWKMIWILLALQLAVSAVSEAPYASPSMVAKVTKAVPTDELIVVVHQLPELVEPTVSLLTRLE